MPESGKLSISIRRNAGAIVTAVVALALVLYYLVIIIPGNKRDIDRQNMVNLTELNNQFKVALTDHANAIQVTRFKKAVARNAAQVLKQVQKDNKSLPLLRDLTNENGSLLRDWASAIVVREIRITNVSDGGDCLKLQTLNRLELDSNALPNGFARAGLADVPPTLLTIVDTVLVPKKSLRDRLNGAVNFTSWIIFSRAGKDDGTRTYVPLINTNVDAQEADSLLKSRAGIEGITYRFSDKRFYKHYYTFAEGDFDFMLAASVLSAGFNNAANRVSVLGVVFCFLIVLLLFLSVPLLKPILSSSSEKLTQMDLINATLCVGVLVVVIVCFSFTTYLNSLQSGRTEKRLQQLQHNVTKAMQAELSAYINDMNTCELLRSETGIVSQRLAKPAPNGLQNFFMMGSNGNLNKDLFVENNRSLRKNFSDRSYFKLLSDTSRKQYNKVFSAAYSKNNNNFVCIYATRLAGGSVRGLAYSPGFGKKIETGLDYGYLLCDYTGRVLLHSNARKSLNENVYFSTNRHPGILNLLRGYTPEPFTTIYNNEQHLFYGERIHYGDEMSSMEGMPLYLFAFKKLEFEEELTLYTIVNSFSISLAYVLCVVLLVVFYSGTFYLRHVPVFSRFHIYWLFPDNSRAKEYRAIVAINYLMVLLVVVPLAMHSDAAWYLGILAGINVVFYNFVLLSQRVFSAEGNQLLRRKWLALLVLTVFVAIALGVYAYLRNRNWLGIVLGVIVHCVFLRILAKQNKQVDEPASMAVEKPEYVPGAKQPFIAFLVSVIVLHFFVVPIVVVFAIYGSEIKKVSDIDYSLSHLRKYVTQGRSGNGQTLSSNSVWLNPPSRALLQQAATDKVVQSPYREDTVSLLPGLGLYKPLVLCMWLGAVILLIWAMVRFYTGRFFFFDLTEIFRQGYFKTRNQFENPHTILPPYSNHDLTNLEKYERYGDEEKSAEAAGVLNKIPDKVVSKSEKLEFIMQENLRHYNEGYQAIWKGLQPDERAVLFDFASDHFVNYKNKDCLVRLMEKGLVVTDALSGRLKVMNLGFRNFVMQHAPADTEVQNIEESNKSQAVFSQWRLPILIVALTISLLAMYLYRQSFDQIVLVGGSAISIIGLVAKFLETYKKTV